MVSGTICNTTVNEVDHEVGHFVRMRIWPEMTCPGDHGHFHVADSLAEFLHRSLMMS